MKSPGPQAAPPRREPGGEGADGRPKPAEPRGASSHAGRWVCWAVALAGLILLAAGVHFWPWSHQNLDDQERRGRQIYFEGASPGGGEIKAYIGQPPVVLPGSAATCVSCHGADGLGRPEAGVIPSDVTWDHLMKRYGHAHLRGRSHPAFTEASLKRAILTGVDPAGNRLDPSMPTYSMSAEDINDLVAYMKKLRADLDPGIGQGSLRIGIVEPARGPAGSIAQSMAEVMIAYLDEVNSWGGVYHRKLELIRITFDNPRESGLDGARRLLEQDVFAVLGAVLAGAETEVAELAETRRVPLLIPFTPLSMDPSLLNEYTFRLLSGWREEVSALCLFADQKLRVKRPRVALLGPAGPDRREELDRAMEELCQNHGWTWTGGVDSPVGSSEAGLAASRLKELGVEALFVLEPGGLKSLLDAAEPLTWAPYVFLTSGSVRQDLMSLPSSFQGRVYASYPTLPSDQTSEGRAEFQSLLDRGNISVNHPTAQMCALVAARVLVEGLKKAGRDLSRQRFLASLREIRQFKTGLVPELSFGPNRRIGALGAYIVAVDLERKAFAPAGGWIDVSAP